MKSGAEVKKDLHRLRKITHRIDVMFRVRERQQKRIEYLRRNGASMEDIQEAERIECNLKMLRIEEGIREATRLESNYMEAIGKLPPIDRTIIMDGYINGKAFWRIGEAIGYSEIAVKKRAGKAVEALAKIL